MRTPQPPHRALAACALSLLLAAAPQRARSLPGDLAPAAPEKPAAVVQPPAELPGPGDPPPAVPPRAAAPRAAKPEDDFDDDEGPPEPPLGPVAVFLLEALSGSLHWLGGALVGSLASDVGLAAGRSEREPIRSAVALAAGPFASGFGASWVGDYNGRPGSFWAATGAGALGEAAGFVPMALAAPDSPFLVRLVPPTLLAGLAAAAATTFTAEEVPSAARPAALSGLAVGGSAGALSLSLSGRF